MNETHDGVAVVICDRNDRTKPTEPPHTEYVEIEHGRVFRDETIETRFVSVRVMVCTGKDMVYPMTVGTSKQDDLKSALAWARGRVADAVEMLPKVRRICQAERYRGKRLSRDEYENACRTLGVSAMSDVDIDSYAVKYGEFTLPWYDAETIVRMGLARARLNQIEDEKPDDDELFFAQFCSMADSEFYKPDASPTDEPCARCGSRRAMWIAGAGESLCAKHQDDY